MRALGNMKTAATAALPRILKSLEEDEESLVREFAAQALPQIAPGNEEAAPVLVKALKDEEADVRIAAAKALPHFANELTAHLPKIIEALGDPEPEIATGLSITLAQIGPPALKPLLEAAESKTRQLRQNSMQALALLGYQSEEAAVEALPQLIKGLKDTDWQTRRAAARGLSTMGGKAKAAIPALNSAMRDPNKFVRRAAAAAMLEIDME
jgi:HEAT repeat protein